MYSIASILELLMLICFGLSWPVNIRKLYLSRSTRGASIYFYFLIWFGYICGITSKLVMITSSDAAWYVTVSWYVMLIYIVNFFMLTGGILVWFRNRRLEKAGAVKS